LTTRDETLRVRGVVTDADRVLDIFILVGLRKVFYLSNREGTDPRRLAFDVPLPLEPGSNAVLVVARESSDVVARRVLVLRRQDASP
jgi:carboxyl-terminal processing protease